MTVKGLQTKGVMLIKERNFGNGMINGRSVVIQRSRLEKTALGENSEGEIKMGNGIDQILNKARHLKRRRSDADIMMTFTILILGLALRKTFLAAVMRLVLGDQRNKRLRLHAAGENRRCGYTTC